MGDQDVILSLIYNTYQAIYEPACWVLILGELQRMLRANACDLSKYDLQARSGEIIVHSGCYDNKYLQLYKQRFAPINPWMQRSDCYREDDTCWLGYQIVPQERLINSGFYEGWLQPQNLLHRLSAVAIREGSRIVYLSALRGKDRGSFRHGDVQLLHRLLPHLRQALRVREMWIGPATVDADSRPKLATRLGGMTCPELAPVPNSCRETNEQRLVRIYQLTAAEARFAVQLACGLSLAQVADALGVSITTVRTHLHRVYSKTSTNHQGQLVSLLIVGPAKLDIYYKTVDTDESCHGQ